MFKGDSCLHNPIILNLSHAAEITDVGFGLKQSQLLRSDSKTFVFRGILEDRLPSDKFHVTKYSEAILRVKGINECQHKIINFTFSLDKHTHWFCEVVISALLMMMRMSVWCH